MEFNFTEANALYVDMLEKIEKEARDMETRIKCGELYGKDEIEQWGKNWMKETPPLKQFAELSKEAGEASEAEDIENLANEVEERIKEQVYYLSDMLEEFQKARDQGGSIITNVTADNLRKGKELSLEMKKKIDDEAREMQKKLNNGVLVTVKEIKEWRRGWMDKIVAIRQLAKEVKAVGDEDEADEIKDIAVELEDYAKDLESEMRDDADILEESQERGGVLTHEDRFRLAAKEGRQSYGLACPNCGAALPDAKTEICGYCGSMLLEDDKGEKVISKGWVLLQEEAEKKSASPKVIYEAAKQRIEALEQTYKAQMEAERQGLLAILEAGKKRTEEFNNALDDSNVRLDRIWDRIRQVGQKAEDRLSRLEASNLEDKLGNYFQNVCDKLGELNRTVMEGVERKANFAWNKKIYEGIKCSHCGAKLEIENPEKAGEAVCKHCNGVTKYGAHASELDVTINKMIDKQMDVQMPLEEQFQYWKGICIDKPTDENKKKYEEAARAMYDKQLFYIKDEAKRKENVDRYVIVAMKEIR